MANDKTIIRTRKNRENPYVMIDKTGLDDERLSLKAKGLLSYLLSKPDDWQISVSHLVKTCKDGEDSVRAGLNELRENGYLSMERIRDDKGRMKGTEFIVYERPLNDFDTTVTRDESISGKSRSGKSRSGKTTSGKSDTTNKRSLLSNKNKQNNDLTNNKKGVSPKTLPSQKDVHLTETTLSVVVDLLSKHDIDINPKTLVKWSELENEKNILAAIEDATSNPKVKNVVGYVTRMLEQGYTPPIPGSEKKDTLPKWIVKQIEDTKIETPAITTPDQQQEILDLLFKLGEITKEEHVQKSKELEQRFLG